MRLIDKAGSKRVLHPNTAARKKSHAASIVARGPQEAKTKRAALPRRSSGSAFAHFLPDARCVVAVGNGAQLSGGAERPR